MTTSFSAARWLTTSHLQQQFKTNQLTRDWLTQGRSTTGIHSSAHWMGGSSQLRAESGWTAPDRAEANKKKKKRASFHEVISCAVWRLYGLSRLLLPFSQQAPRFHFCLPGGVLWFSVGLLLRTKISLRNAETMISVNPSDFFPTLDYKDPI